MAGLALDQTPLTRTSPAVGGVFFGSDPVDAEKFWSRAAKGPDCWEWTGARTNRGYGEFRIGRVKHVAHRLAYRLAVGPIPDGLQMDHLCRNRGCVRPSHLEPVTRKENILRGISPSAANARKTHCPQGHPYSGSNLAIFHDGYKHEGRHCRTCRSVRHRIYRASNVEYREREAARSKLRVERARR